MADDDNKLASKDSGGGMPAIRSKAFRNGLLTRLPKLSTPTWRAGNVTAVHGSISGLSDLNADSFLDVIARFSKKTDE